MVTNKIMKRILLIGDRCRDVYINLIDASRSNPEASVPLYIVDKKEEKEGMSANVAVGLTNLGFQVTHRSGLMSTKTRVSINGQLSYRADDDVVSWSYDESELNLNKYDAVIVSDYDKGFVTEETLLYIQKLYKGPKFIDTKKSNLGILKGWIVKINALEYERIKHPELYLPYNKFYVTYGSGGLVCINTNEFTAPRASSQVDPCGAGDAALVGLVYGYLNNEGHCPSIVAACYAGLSVEYVGVYMPTKQELETAITKYYE